MFRSTDDPKEVFRTINEPIVYKNRVYLNGKPIINFKGGQTVL